MNLEEMLYMSMEKQYIADFANYSISNLIFITTIALSKYLVQTVKESQQKMMTYA